MCKIIAGCDLCCGGSESDGGAFSSEAHMLGEKLSGGWLCGCKGPGAGEGRLEGRERGWGKRRWMPGALQAGLGAVVAG